MAAPNLKEIEWAIEELENQESNERRYTLLAALYTCRNEMLGLTAPAAQAAAYSEAPAPDGPALGQYGDSDFLQAVAGKDPASAWAVIDELMDTLRVVNQRMYESVMRKLGRI